MSLTKEVYESAIFGYENERRIMDAVRRLSADYSWGHVVWYTH